VDAITTEDILKVLSPLWIGKTETAKWVRARIENILDYAAALQYRDSLNPARWRGHLDKLLPQPSQVRTVRHHPAMPYSDVPTFMADLAGDGRVPALALRFLILTATRTGEVLHARWDEIDERASVWAIPAARMKARRMYRVPLTGATMSVLERLPHRSHRADSAYLFPGFRDGRPLSSMALLILMREMDYGVDGDRGAYVPHGFRASFRDWSEEVSSFPRDVAEIALAHVIENRGEAAYRRGDLFDKRRRMMQEWADYVCRELAEPLS